MVSGIGSAGSGNNFLQRPFSSGSGVFSVSDDNPRNILQLDPVFKPPSEELREAEEQRIEDNPLLDSQSSQNGSGDNSGTQQNSIAAQPRLGESISRLAVEEGTRKGGSNLDVEGGEITFGAGDREITIGDDDEARILKNDDGTVTIQNQTSGEEQAFDAGDRLELSGEGEAVVSGIREQEFQSGNATAERQTGRELSFSAGEAIEIGSEGGGTLARPGSAKSIAIESDQATAIAIAGETGEQFVFTNDAGQTIEFEAGETGTITRGDDGNITITNDTTETSATFSTEQGLSTGGNATARLRTQGGDRLDFEGRDAGQFQTDDGTLELANEATVESVRVEAATDPIQPERPLQLQTFDNPEAQQLQRLQEELIRRPDEEARAAAAEAEAEEEPEETEEADEESVEEEEAPQPASFQQEETNSPVPGVSTEQTGKDDAPLLDEEENLFGPTESDEEVAIDPGEEELSFPGFNNEEETTAFSEPEPVGSVEVVDDTDESFAETGQQVNFRA